MYARGFPRSDIAEMMLVRAGGLQRSRDRQVCMPIDLRSMFHLNPRQTIGVEAPQTEAFRLCALFHA
jgi:hypothetical protein